MDPTRLSRELRTSRHPHMRRRRVQIGLNLACAAIGGVVAAYQTGLIRRLPDPPVGPFDSERVDASDYAYKRADTPDGLLMVLTYAASAVLAGAGGEDRARDKPWLPILAAAKAAYDVQTAARLAKEEWDENEALCFYCQTASVLTLVSAALAVPEAVEGVKQLV